MEFDSNRNEIGEDNEDILAENRRKNARIASEAETTRPRTGVNASQLRTQMQSARKPTSPTASRPVAKANPTRTASTPVKPGIPSASRPSAASAARPTAAAASRQAPKASAVVSSTALPSSSTPSARPSPATSSVASHPAGDQKSAPRAAAPSSSVAAVSRTPASATRSNASSMPSRIPYQKAAAASLSTPQEENEKTRMTDARGIRPVKGGDATRLTDISDLRNERLIPKEEPPQDESEGGNTIISIIKAITYIVAVVVVAIFLSVFIILVGNDVYAFVKDDQAVEITIPEYATLDDVADILFENNIIQYPSVFKLYAHLQSDDGQFLAGTYSDVSPMMNYDELLQAFKAKAPSGISRITIPEGYTTDEIIDLFVSRGIGTREGYVDVINNYAFDYWFIDALGEDWDKDGRIYRLDGYLFPDTYEFYNASSEATVIGKLLKRFYEVFLDSYVQKAEELGYTVDEILTLASMIEKEAGTQSDFFNISSVFHNRLRNAAAFPYLESDATVVYAIQHDTGERITPTPEDLEYDTPYNTYRSQGLPPGPIANPSASAIRAALYPADTKYYYFVSASSRVTYYATTLAEHNKNIELIRSGETVSTDEASSQE